MATDIQGSWFPTGYYGHFRSKSRPDFVCEYRQLAKPQPPQKFYVRAKTFLREPEPSKKHVFSHHDNRQAFLNDAVVFSQGLGRRRVPNSTYHFKNDFMAWMPEREYVERSRPLASTYKQDFMAQYAREQLLTKRPKTSFEGVPTTSYRYAHGTACPNKTTIDAMNNAALNLSFMHRKDRAMSAVSRGRESVASCLTWVSNTSKQNENVRPVVPSATQTTQFVPHPPSVPKQQPSQVSAPIVQEAWTAPPEPVQQQAPPSAPPPQQAAPPAPVAPPPQPAEPMAQ